MSRIDEEEITDGAALECRRIYLPGALRNPSRKYGEHRERRCAATARRATEAYCLYAARSATNL